MSCTNWSRSFLKLISSSFPRMKFNLSRHWQHQQTQWQFLWAKGAHIIQKFHFPFYGFTMALKMTAMLLYGTSLFINRRKKEYKIWTRGYIAATLKKAVDNRAWLQEGSRALYPLYAALLCITEYILCEWDPPFKADKIFFRSILHTR